MTTEPLSYKSLKDMRSVVEDVIDTVEEELAHTIPEINALELPEVDFNTLLEQFPTFFQDIVNEIVDSASMLANVNFDALGEVSDKFNDLLSSGEFESLFVPDSNAQPINFSLNDKNINNDLADAEQIMQRVNRSAGTSFEGMLKKLEDDGVIVRGKTTSGLIAPASVRAPVKGSTYEGPTFGGGVIRVGEVKSSDAVTGRQPGILEDTNVLFANANPEEVPEQQIIDTLDEMCDDLGIRIQITARGGKISKPTGTNSKQNHVEGYAADFQVIDNGRLLFPRDYPDLYGKIVSKLQEIANDNDIRPGIGGYPTYIHYDEGPYRQKLYPGSKVAWWNNGFPVENYLELE